jgi:hypothetical protein
VLVNAPAGCGVAVNTRHLYRSTDSKISVDGHEAADICQVAVVLTSMRP